MNYQLINSISMGITTCNSTWAVNESGASYHRMYYIYGGDAVYTCKNRKIKLKDNYVYIFPINVKYSIIQNKEDPLRCLWVHFAIFPYILNDIIYFSIDDDETVKLLFKVLEIEISNKARNNELINSLILTVVKKIEKVLKLSYTENEKICDVINYIHNNYCNEIENAELSSIASLEVHYFVKIFKQYLGVTPQKYVRNLRCMMAVEYLSARLNIDEVAVKVGYSDCKAFSRAFKKTLGYPPKYCKRNASGHVFDFNYP